MSHIQIDSEVLHKVKERKSFIIKSLLTWSTKNLSIYPWRKNITPYNILVSELLLRKTRADNVSRVFLLFLEQFPTINDLSNTPLENLRKYIYSLGRMKRDKEIITIARTIAEKYYGEIPSSEKDLFYVIGKQSKYTVNAIRCFAYGERVPVFDVNVNRIFSRVFSIDLGKQPHKNEKAWKLAEMILPRKKVKEFNWALLDLGRLICTYKPRCEICPLSSICDYAINIRTTLQ